MAIITVLELPPKESFNSLVNFESISGTYILLPFSLFPDKAFMQLPKVNNDLLILAPSINLNPLFLVTLALSLPAKSIKFNFPYFI